VHRQTAKSEVDAGMSERVTGTRYDSGWRIGDRIQGRWEIHDILQGGMGTVYVVFDRLFRLKLAAKTFQDCAFAQNRAAADRFTKEALAWINLGAHPNVTRAYFVETIRGKPFVFSEFVGGGSLRDWIGQPGLLDDLSEVLRLGIEFCDGMSHAASNGISVHRDIKPDNCLLSRHHTLKVTDFGLAKIFDHVVQEAENSEVVQRRLAVWQSQTGAGAGTLAYMAPEQFEDAKHVDVRADIYSFGVMLFEMVTGTIPFVASSAERFYLLHKTRQPRLLEGSPHLLNTVLQTCLAKSPEQRFASFDAVRQQVAEIYERVSGRTAPQRPLAVELSGVEWTMKASSLTNLGRDAEALECVDHALRLDGRSAVTWTLKGEVLTNLGRFQEAVACHDRAITLAPESANPWYRKGRALAKAERFDEAVVCYDHALSIDPADGTAWFYKGDTTLEMGSFDEALACYLRSLECNRDDDNAWYGMGSALQKLGRPKEAIACYDRGLQLNALSVEAWCNRGFAANSLGRIRRGPSLFRPGSTDEPSRGNGVGESWSRLI
jgi:tetratricopeptide (TPR) repeat protein/tRNA A-37 threonylcarbamoyl transferase component Bud32